MLSISGRNGDNEGRKLLFFAGRDEGAGDLIVLEGEDIGDLFPNMV
jgi:hypothetical protein